MNMGIFFDHLLVASRQEALPLTEICRRAAEMGYRYVDIDGAYYQENLRDTDAALDAAGLAIGCVDGRFDLAHGRDADGAEALIRLASRRGVPHVLLIPGYVEAGEKREAVMERIAEALPPLVRLACELGVRCSLEDYDAAEAPYGTAEELAWYMRRVPELGCSFDTGNFFYFGEDAARALETLKPYIVMLHLKDRAARSLRGERGTPAADGKTLLYPCAVGEGDMPIKPIVEAFAGQDVPMTVEHFGAERMLEVMQESARVVLAWG